MSAATSGIGLSQLSLENAYSVRTPIPAWGAASIAASTARAPAA